MTGSWVVTVPALIVAPHKAQTVLPPSAFFSPPPVIGRSSLFPRRGIVRESKPGLLLDSSIFPRNEIDWLTHFLRAVWNREKFHQKSLTRLSFSCSGRDLNPHAFRHTPLKRTCLPFHHPSLPDCETFRRREELASIEYILLTHARNRNRNDDGKG